MVDLSGIDRPPSLVDRAKAIILAPKDEWPRIALESSSTSDILRSYVLPLAAIGPVAALIGYALEQAFAGGQILLIWSLSTAIVSYALWVVSVFVLAFVANLLAPQFEGVSSHASAFKWIAYSYTATWLASLFWLVPALRFFSLLGLYSFYVLFSGTTAIMKVPPVKATGYVAVVGLCAIVMTVAATRAATPIVGIWVPDSQSFSRNDVSGTVSVPGGGSVDLDKIQQATKRMEAAANGKSPPADPERMKALLPATIGFYQRTATESAAMGPAGSTAQGTYTAGDKTFTLKISDMAALGAMSGLGAAMGVEQSKEDANSYERTTTVNGQIQTEAWNKTSNSGKYGVTVNNRFMIEADGTAGSIDELKQAVGSIDQDDLADLVG